MTSDEAREELDAARREAKEQLNWTENQGPLIRAESRALGWLLQENNLAARFRKAMRMRRPVIPTQGVE